MDVARSARLLLALLALALAPTALAADSGVIPYLSGGAGVLIDEQSGWPVAGSAPSLPGLHFRPAFAPPPVTPSPPVPPPEAPDPAPPPPAPEPTPPAPVPVPVPVPPSLTVDPVYVVDPALGGYAREDMTAAAGVPVFCRTDERWPTDPALATATGYFDWVTRTITMRVRRCEGIAPSKVGTEPFARGLFVLAHERAHSRGQSDECDADKTGVADMPSLAVQLGYTLEVGENARELLLTIFRAAPLPPPYCLGSF